MSTSIRKCVREKNRYTPVRRSLQPGGTWLSHSRVHGTCFCLRCTTQLTMSVLSLLQTVNVRKKVIGDVDGHLKTTKIHCIVRSVMYWVRHWSVMYWVRHYSASRTLLIHSDNTVHYKSKNAEFLWFWMPHCIVYNLPHFLNYVLLFYTY